MPDKAVFETYLAALRRKPVAEKTEHTDRGALEALLAAFAAGADGKPEVQHEPRRVAGKGAPDFKIVRQGLILGYVENKAIGEDLKKVAKSDQIDRYKTLSQNILLTDYLEFVWISKDGQQRAVLCDESTLEKRKNRLQDEAIAAVARLLVGFFSSPPQRIADSKTLAEALAKRSRLLRDYLGEELIRQGKVHQEGRLYGLFQTFRDQVFHELTPAEFADAFAQMLAYGLFLARLNSGKHAITLNNAREYVPGSFRLIRELVDFLNELDKPEYTEVRWVVEEVLSIVNGLDLAAIHDSLSFRGRKAISRKVRAVDEEEHRLFERDPFIYFYEDYLKAYDKDMRKSRGVYYTPPPVVNFIIRAVDDILKDNFNIRAGLSDHKRVTVLDFACGTGTFLLEVFQRIFEEIGGANSARAGLMLREHILKNLFGFEYLIAPYTIAHLKLSQFLKDRGHPLTDQERLQVFLTNTLEPIEPQRNLYLPAVTAEVEAAQKVKDSKILVIMGNPPYSGVSRNMGAAAQSLVERYKFVDGKHFGERKHWLQDDYVKFIAFAQKKMDSVDEGVVGIITNHNYLDGPTFRGMRQSLLGTFNHIIILDLHGSLQRIEDVPPGVKDQNVFDIKPGVAIALFIKSKGKGTSVRQSDLWGTREEKYRFLASSALNDIPWHDVDSRTPHYFFENTEMRGMGLPAEHALDKIFVAGSTALQTSRDDFATAFSKTDIEKRISDLRNDAIRDDVFRRLLKEKKDSKLPTGDSDFWNLNDSRRALSQEKAIKVVPLMYRPFDIRFLIYDDAVVHRMKREVSDEMLSGKNLSLLIPRQLSSVEYRHVFVANQISEMCVVSSATKEQNRVFPLWHFEHGLPVRENLTVEFRAFLDSRYEHHYTPEEILGYVYSVLHAPQYRARNAEALRIDFPQVPFPEDAEYFEDLSKLGWALVEAHLLRTLPRKGLAQYDGKGDHAVEAVRYAPAQQAIWINPTQCFRPVPEAVWTFHIGGYQVLDKYLKSRKGRILSLEEINHVGAVADSLAFTIDQMARIDKAYQRAFPAVDNAA